MSEADRLYMVQVAFDFPSVLANRRDHALRSGDTEDLGYLTHCQLRAVFGDRGPSPFLTRVRGRTLDVLAYSAWPASELLEASALAEPRWAEPRSVHSKPMPSSWEPGRRLRFEVRACPIVRTAEGERDAYLHALDRAETEGRRRAVPEDRSAPRSTENG